MLKLQRMLPCGESANPGYHTPRAAARKACDAARLEAIMLP